jgi:hypothetical protein
MLGLFLFFDVVPEFRGIGNVWNQSQEEFPIYVFPRVDADSIPVVLKK